MGVIDYTFGGGPALGNFYLVNGYPSEPGGGTILAPVNEATVLVDGKIREFVIRSYNQLNIWGSAVFKIWIDGSVAHTTAAPLEQIQNNQGRLTTYCFDPALTVTAGQKIAIERDAGTQLGQSNCSIRVFSPTSGHIYRFGGSVTAANDYLLVAGSVNSTVATTLTPLTEATAVAGGDIYKIAWNSINGASDTVLQLVVNGSSTENITLTGASGVLDLSTTTISKGNQIAVRYSSGTNPGDMTVFILADGAEGQVFNYGGNLTAAAGRLRTNRPADSTIGGDTLLGSHIEFQSRVTGTITVAVNGTNNGSYELSVNETTAARPTVLESFGGAGAVATYDLSTTVDLNDVIAIRSFGAFDGNENALVFIQGVDGSSYSCPVERAGAVITHTRNALPTNRAGSIYVHTRGAPFISGLIRGPQFRSNTIGGDRFVTSLTSVLSQQTVNLSGTGSTTVYTVPTGKAAFIHGIILRGISGSASTNATVSVGINPSTDNLFDLQELLGVQAIHDVWSFWHDKSTTLIANSGEQVVVDVAIAATGSLQSQVYVLGFVV